MDLSGAFATTMLLLPAHLLHERIAALMILQLFDV
jgi:hypothetical protein